MHATRRTLSRSCAVLLVAFAGACASSSKDFAKMKDDALIAEVKSVQTKIDKKEVPQFKETGDASVDLLIKPYVDAATESAPKALLLVAECNNSQIIELVNKSVDAELKKQNLSAPTAEQRTNTTIAVLKVLKPEERKMWDEWVAKYRKRVEAEKANSTKLGEQAVKILADLGQKVLAAKQGGAMAALTGGKAVLALDNGISQVNSVKDFTGPADELIARYSGKIEAHDKMASQNMKR